MRELCKHVATFDPRIDQRTLEVKVPSVETGDYGDHFHRRKNPPPEVIAEVSRDNEIYITYAPYLKSLKGKKYENRSIIELAIRAEAFKHKLKEVLEKQDSI